MLIEPICNASDMIQCYAYLLSLLYTIYSPSIMIAMNSSCEISPSPSMSNSSIIACLLLAKSATFLAYSSSSPICSPSSFATRRRLRNEMRPVLSSSKSANARLSSSSGSRARIFSVTKRLWSATFGQKPSETREETLETRKIASACVMLRPGSSGLVMFANSETECHPTGTRFCVCFAAMIRPRVACAGCVCRVLSAWVETPGHPPADTL